MKIEQIPTNVFIHFKRIGCILNQSALDSSPDLSPKQFGDSRWCRRKLTTTYSESIVISRSSGRSQKMRRLTTETSHSSKDRGYNALANRRFFCRCKEQLQARFA